MKILYSGLHRIVQLDEQTGAGKIWYIAVKLPDSKMESQDFEEGKSETVQQYLNSLCKECVSVVSSEHH